MLERAEAVDVARRLVESSPLDASEVRVTHVTDSFLRYAGTGPTQDAVRDVACVSVRVMDGARTGKATAGTLDAAALDRALERACAAAAVAPEDPEPLPLPGPQDYAPKDCFSDATAGEDFGAKAAAVSAARDACAEKDLDAVGMAQTWVRSETVVNSEGLEAHHASSRAHFTTTATGEGASGWADSTDFDARGVDARDVAERAAEKGDASRHAADVAPGRYDVVMEPAALSALLGFAAWQGLGAQQVEEGSSFLAGRRGEDVMGGAVTLGDDVFHPLHIGDPFDGEGVARVPVRFVEGGVARGPVHDRRTARAAGCASTGHAVPQPSPMGPMPEHLVFSAGDANLDAMIAATERGILVTRFHYTNLIDPVRLDLTGMTRNGTFLIENGEIAGPVKNLRFTESLVGLLGRVKSVGSECVLAEGFFGGEFVVPALSVGDFRFTSAAEF